VFSPSRTRQYLNITPNNVLQIYSECDRTSEITRTQVTQSPVPFQTLLAQPVFTPKSKNMHSTSTPSSKGHRLFTTSHHAEPRPLAERVNYKSLDKQSKCLGKLSNLSDQLEKQITGRQPATTNQDSANRSNILHNNSSTQGNTARLTNQNDFCPSRLTNQQPDCTKTSSLNTNQHLFDDGKLILHIKSLQYSLYLLFQLQHYQRAIFIVLPTTIIAFVNKINNIYVQTLMMQMLQWQP